jgi:2-dehydropantoate 2-reductase
MFDQVIVFGAGAVGSAYAALLSKKLPVTIVARSEQVKAVAENGLTVTGEAAGNYKVSAVETLDKIEPKTLVLLTVKSYDVRAAAEQLKSLIQSDTIVLCLQNGLGAYAEAQEILSCSVEQGITHIAVSYFGPGKINLSGINKLVFGEGLLEDNPIPAALVSLFKSVGVPAEATPFFAKCVWEKLVNNCWMNPIGALFNVHYDETKNPDMGKVFHAIFKECQIVAGKEGVQLPDRYLNEMLSKLQESHHRVSMLQDIDNKRKTEIDYINGAIVKLGKKHNVPTPVNETIVNLIHYLESRNATV